MARISDRAVPDSRPRPAQPDRSTFALARRHQESYRSLPRSFADFRLQTSDYRLDSPDELTVLVMRCQLIRTSSSRHSPCYGQSRCRESRPRHVHEIEFALAPDPSRRRLWRPRLLWRRWRRRHARDTYGADLALCSIVESESFINPPLHESNSTKRLDATTANHFNRIHDTSGPRNNPFIFNNTDLYAVDEVWLHRASAAVVRASVHPANRVNTTDGLASAGLWALGFGLWEEYVRA